MLSPGEEADSRYFIPLLEQISLPGSMGRLRKRCRYVLADKGYDSQMLRKRPANTPFKTLRLRSFGNGSRWRSLYSLAGFIP